MKKIVIAVIDYPTASRSSVYGITETIELANKVCEQINVDVLIEIETLGLDVLDCEDYADVVILPPCIGDEFYTTKSEVLIQYLKVMQKKGAVLASACVGAFILAKAGFLDNKFCTTHWRLAELFKRSFPKAKLTVNAMIVNEGGVITAGGRMAWLDLTFEIISSFCSPAVAVQLSKEMVVDSGHREQKFYTQFIPKYDHHDELVEKVQLYLHENYASQISVAETANTYFVSIRTLQRRFLNSTGMSVIDYLQKLRLHNACKLIELTSKSIMEVSFSVGYQNVSAFRKIFVREYGLSPSEFRKRFSIK